MELPPAYCLIIPEPVREKLGLKAGDWVAFEEQNGGQFAFRKFKPASVDNDEFKNQFPFLTMASDWLGIYEEENGTTSYTSKMAQYLLPDEEDEED